MLGICTGKQIPGKCTYDVRTLERCQQSKKMQMCQSPSYSPPPPQNWDGFQNNNYLLLTKKPNLQTNISFKCQKHDGKKTQPKIKRTDCRLHGKSYLWSQSCHGAVGEHRQRETGLVQQLEKKTAPASKFFCICPHYSEQYNVYWTPLEAIPCLATIKLAIQSGTLVPAARKVMPMITSGIPRV